MHIPDGYLGPITYGLLWLMMIPIWIISSRKVGERLHTKQVPLLAIGAAFSFVIMMFNVPIPGGSTGHAVGGVLLAIVLGPWAALISVSIALVVQAFFFGDGGITAIAANCFNMGFVMPFVGYYVYKAISKNSPLTSSRRLIASGIAGYVGLNVAALFTSIMIGIQPHIPDGDYSPYGLNIAVPAMMIQHLLFFGFVEAIITMLVMKYIQAEDVSLLEEAEKGGVGLGY